MYELIAYNTDCRYQKDIRYRKYTGNKKLAENFSKIPKIQFSDSGHGIVFVVREHSGKREPLISELADYVYKQLNIIEKKENEHGYG
jgi:glucan phosphorylase